jgi:flagellar operon protein
MGIQPISAVGRVSPVQNDPQKNTKSFDIVLQRRIQERELQFSKHATERLGERRIELTQEQLGRIAEGVIRARGKGITDSLVLVDDVALVVNTQNNVVITAMHSKTKDVFTNIDGAVVV